MQKVLQVAKGFQPDEEDIRNKNDASMMRTTNNMSPDKLDLSKSKASIMQNVMRRSMTYILKKRASQHESGTDPLHDSIGTHDHIYEGTAGNPLIDQEKSIIQLAKKFSKVQDVEKNVNTLMKALLDEQKPMLYIKGLLADRNINIEELERTMLKIIETRPHTNDEIPTLNELDMANQAFLGKI